MDEIIKQHQPFLENYSLRLTGCPQRAKDLQQDTLIKFWRAYKKGSFVYESKPKTKGFLGATMHNQFVNDFVRSKRLRNISYNWIEPDLLLNFHPSTTNTVWRAFEREDIESMVEQLPSVYQEALSMRGLGYKYGEIAEILGVPIGTVRSKIRRGRELLNKNK